MHSLDQAATNFVPRINTYTSYVGAGFRNICDDKVVWTNGDILYSLSNMLHQVSCKPHVRNSGNYYSTVATLTDGYNTKTDLQSNSICPTGWQPPISDTASIRSFNNLFEKVYKVDGSGGIEKDVQFASLPLSFMKFGRISESSEFSDMNYGFYWGNMIANGFMFGYWSVHVNYNYSGSKNVGLSLRCVARKCVTLFRRYYKVYDKIVALFVNILFLI